MKKKYLKYLIIFFITIIFKITFLFPIKKNSILFFSFSGLDFTCNPKYIYLHLNSKNNNYKYYWAFKNPKLIDKSIFSKNTTIIKYPSLKFFFIFFISKIIITNDTFPPFLTKKKTQKIIQTWHAGGAYKKVGNDFTSGSLTNKLTYKTLSYSDIFLSSSFAFTKFNILSGFNYRGKVLNSGLPRNDILIHKKDNVKLNILKKLKLENYKLIVLLAPTFTNYNNNFFTQLNYDKILKTLSKRNKINENQIIFILKMHKKDHFSSFEKKINFNLVDYSTYSDTQDLLIISDILITNYSSIIWDYSLMFKEGYLYVPDLKKYRLKRNFYIDIKNWPYPICKNFRNLIDAMKDYDSFKAHDKIKLHHKNLSSYESGKSCLLIENEIKNLMEE